MNASTTKILNYFQNFLILFLDGIKNKLFFFFNISIKKNIEVNIRWGKKIIRICYVIKDGKGKMKRLRRIKKDNNEKERGS